MNLHLEAKFRLRLPQPKNLGLQSLYIFNLYRAGSSVVEAAAESLAKMSGRTENNVTKALYEAGVEYFDTKDFSKSAVYLADDGVSLLRLCDIGGYVNYGFREVPIGFGQGFSHFAAALLIVRDIRDIGISQYNSVAGHVEDDRVYGDQIRRLRVQTSKMSVEEFILRDDTIAFLNRIAMSYRPMIQRGINMVQYEDLYLDGHFNTEMLCERIYSHFSSFDDGTWDFDGYVDNTIQRIKNSPFLQGHSTGGKIRVYETLPDKVKAAYTEKLKEALQLLHYL